jgi:hypothetical protein
MNVSEAAWTGRRQVWLGRKRAWIWGLREVRMRREREGDIGCVDVVRGVMRVRSGNIHSINAS